MKLFVFAYFLDPSLLGRRSSSSDDNITKFFANNWCAGVGVVYLTIYFISSSWL